MTNTEKIVTGVLVGTIVGTALGVLLAPKKGAKTRALIADKARDLGSSTTTTYKKAKDMLGMNRVKEEVAMN